MNQAGAVRFGMGAIKGVGRGAVETIVAQRKENGPYRSVFDLAKRIDLRAANKRHLKTWPLQEVLTLLEGFTGRSIFTSWAMLVLSSKKSFAMVPDTKKMKTLHR